MNRVSNLQPVDSPDVIVLTTRPIQRPQTVFTVPDSVTVSWLVFLSARDPNSISHGNDPMQFEKDSKLIPKKKKKNSKEMIPVLKV